MKQNFDYVHEDETEHEPYDPNSRANRFQRSAARIGMARFPPIYFAIDRRPVPEMTFAIDATLRAEAKQRRIAARAVLLEAERASKAYETVWP